MLIKLFIMETNRLLTIGKANCTLISLLFFGSCAIGYDSPNGFDVGVNNTQVITPDSISFIVNSDGDEATISWPLIMGAKGYEVSFLNVDDPENPFVIDQYDKYLVDGCKMTAPVVEDSKYRLEIRALGDPGRGNTDDTEPIVYYVSTLVESVATIPNGTDIYQYLQEHPIDSINKEVAIDLEPGGIYTMSGQVDFKNQKMTFRGSKINRATVNMINKGAFLTYAGLKIKYINFDMTASTSNSFLFMSKDNLPENIKSQYLGYKRNGAEIKNIYIIQDPIYIANCWFKDMPKSFIHDNEVDCAFWYFTIKDCIVQMKNSKGGPFVNFSKKGRCIKNITFSNSTFYNTITNNDYFIRYSNNSNANPEKVFGNTSSDYNSANIYFSGCTFSQTFNNQNFVNNIPANYMYTTIEKCIFYDVSSVRRISLGNKTYKLNFWYASPSMPKPDTSDPTQKDNSGAPFAAVYDPRFVGDITTSLDFSKENGGVNFKPQELQIIMVNSGDPRWLP